MSIGLLDNNASWPYRLVLMFRRNILSALKMETVRLSKTFVPTCKSTQRYNPEDKHRHLHRRENLRSHPVEVRKPCSSEKKEISRSRIVCNRLLHSCMESWEKTLLCLSAIEFAKQVLIWRANLLRCVTTTVWPSLSCLPLLNSSQYSNTEICNQTSVA
jgi:hypothetical protein